MRKGDVFILSVCLSVCLYVRAKTFECLDMEISLLVWWYILTISRSSLSIKVISWSRSSQGYSHFKVKVILKSNGNVFQFLSRNGRLAFVRMLIFLVLSMLLKSIRCHHMDHFILAKQLSKTDYQNAQRNRVWVRLDYLLSHGGTKYEK